MTIGNMALFFIFVFDITVLGNIKSHLQLANTPLISCFLYAAVMYVYLHIVTCLQQQNFFLFPSRRVLLKKLISLSAFFTYSHQHSLSMQFSILNINVLKKALNDLSMAFVFSEQGDISLTPSGLFKFLLEQNSSGNVLEKLHHSLLLRTPPPHFYLTATPKRIY